MLHFLQMLYAIRHLLYRFTGTVQKIPSGIRQIDFLPDAVDSVTPSSSSSCLMLNDKVLCVIKSSLEASVNESTSANLTKYFSGVSSIRKINRNHEYY